MRLVASEARRRVAERRDRDEIARRAVATTADRVDFLFAGRDRLAELRRVVQPLARKLATRLAARRRRARRGTIDLRRTLRGSLSTGGVPMRPVLRRRRPVRPELVLLCDVSGSVSGFSDFTMLLVQALHDQFSKVRVFAFVNRVDEVTGLLVHGAADPDGLGARINTEATLTGWHDSSDYGVPFGEFTERYSGAVGPRTTVFVLGDARTNNSDPNLPAVRFYHPAGPPRLLAESRGAFAVGHGRLRGSRLRGTRGDARVPQRPAAQRTDRPPPARLTRGPAWTRPAGQGARSLRSQVIRAARAVRESGVSGAKESKPWKPPGHTCSSATP